MKAVVMTTTGEPEVLRLVDVPVPTPGPGQALVRVQSAAVNFSDVMRRRGQEYPDPTPLPFTPGAEVAGVVEAVGEGVAHLAPGTAVFGVVGEHADGGYAEYAIANASNLIPVPDGIELDVAAGLLVVGVTAMVMLSEIGRVEKGSTVFVPAAAGGLGSYAVQIARQLGATTIVAGASTPEKRQIALDLGATHAVEYATDGWAERVVELTGGRGVDVALEFIGPDHLPSTLQTLAPFGHLIVIGSVRGAAGGEHVDGRLLNPFLFNPAPSQSITGLNIGYWFGLRPQATFAALTKLLEWVATGVVRGPAIETLPLHDVVEAHRRLEAGRTTGKLILKP